MTAVVPREVTQARLDRRSAVAATFLASSTFTVADMPGVESVTIYGVQVPGAEGRADMTTTFKLRKLDLQRQGIDPAQCHDPLFVRDDTRGRYVPLTAKEVTRVLAS